MNIARLHRCKACTGVELFFFFALMTSDPQDKGRLSGRMQFSPLPPPKLVSGSSYCFCGDTNMLILDASLAPANKASATLITSRVGKIPVNITANSNYIPWLPTLQLYTTDHSDKRIFISNLDVGWVASVDLLHLQKEIRHWEQACSSLRQIHGRACLSLGLRRHPFFRIIWS